MLLKILLAILLVSNLMCSIKADLSEESTKEETTVALISAADSSSSSTERVKKDVSQQEAEESTDGGLRNSPLDTESVADSEATSSLNTFSYQPYIEYGNVSPQSQSITRIAFGQEAINIFKQNERKNPIQQNVLYFPNEVEKSSEQNLVHTHPVVQQPKPDFVYLPPQPQNNIYVTLPPLIQKPNEQVFLQESPQPQYEYVSRGPGPGDYNNVDPSTLVYITPQPQLQQTLEPITHYLPIPQALYQSPPQDIPAYVLRVNNHIVHRHQPDFGNNYQIGNFDDDKGKRKVIVEDYRIEKNTTNDQSKNKTDEEKDSSKNKSKKESEKEELVEANTAKAIIEEYEKHYVKKHVDKQVDVKSVGDSENVHKTSSTAHSLSEDPIVVEDPYDNNLNFGDKFSTTENTIKTYKPSSLQTITSKTITTHPLGTTFLAPITAGVQLQSVESQKPHFEIEIQKSVPYYLGKFEFIQKERHPRPGRHEEVRNNFALGSTLLKLYDSQKDSQGAYSTINDQKFLAPPSNSPAGKNDYFQMFSNHPSPNNKQLHNEHGHKQKVTKLYPQYNVPWKMHQDISKIPMKSYAYAPNHNHQSGHSKRKPKSFADFSQNRPLHANSFIRLKTNSNLDSTNFNRHSFKPSQQIFSLESKIKDEDSETQQSIINVKGKYRSARHSFGEIRLEYGFMPPLIPSIEIDEFGVPIKKNEE